MSRTAAPELKLTLATSYIKHGTTSVDRNNATTFRRTRSRNRDFIDLNHRSTSTQTETSQHASAPASPDRLMIRGRDPGSWRIAIPSYCFSSAGYDSTPSKTRCDRQQQRLQNLSAPLRYGSSPNCKQRAAVRHPHSNDPTVKAGFLDEALPRNSLRCQSHPPTVPATYIFL